MTNLWSLTQTMFLDSSYQRTEGKGLALDLMQSLVKVGLFCTCMSLLAYALQVTMTKEEITVPFESTVLLL